MKTVEAWLVAVAGGIVIALAAGCDSSDTTTTGDSEVVIAPATAYLDAGAVSIVTFTASGGDSNYTWSLASGSLRTLHTAGGTALYQSTTSAGTNTITVSDASGNIGSATVLQVE